MIFALSDIPHYLLGNPKIYGFIFRCEGIASFDKFRIFNLVCVLKFSVLPKTHTHKYEKSPKQKNDLKILDKLIHFSGFLSVITLNFFSL